MIRGEPFVVATRGSIVESVHAVAAAVAAPDGDLRFAIGDVETPVYLRSAAKPFIAAAVVRSGAAARYDFDAREIATIAASHGGEPFHVDAVRSILTKIGLPVSALRCGAHAPSYEPAARELARTGVEPSALHHNCSGKHAGILALSLVLGADPDDYLAAEHPAERYVLDLCARALGQAAGDLVLGVDGCGIPVFATSLRRGATAFARLASLAELEPGDAEALRVVREAIVAEPDYVAGTGRFDTALARSTAGAIVGKAGAEGVHGDALFGPGLGLALKVVDGAQRAVPPAVCAILEAIGAIPEAARGDLATFADPVLRNAAGLEVGGLSVIRETIASGSAS